MAEPLPPRYADVLLNAPVRQAFSYHVPEALLGVVRVGHLVRVQFGTAMQPGVIQHLTHDAPDLATKPILELLDPEPVVNADTLVVAEWLARRTLCPPGLALWAFLPPGIVGQRDERVTLQAPDQRGEDAVQQAVIDALKRRGPLTGTQLKRSAGKAAARAVTTLKQRGIVSTESLLLPPRVKPQVITQAALAIDPDHLGYVRRRLGKPNRVADLLETLLRLHEDAAQPLPVEAVLALPGIGEATLSKLIDSGGVHLLHGTHIEPAPDAVDVLFRLRDGDLDAHILRVLAREDGPVDVSWVYAQTGATLADLKRLRDYELVTLGEKATWRDPLAGRDFVPVVAPQLTPGQRAAWGVIRQALDAPTTAPHRTYLLHGVTGSGKTEIYLRAVEHVLAQGRQALLLVPEIALTPQTVRRVMARFPGRVALVHSRLTEGERYDAWRRARLGLVDVVVGTRAALFTPLARLGLIVLDEEHDASYKQSPPVSPPYYHARDVAERLAQQMHALVLLGSATPDASTRYRAEVGEIGLLRLPDRIMGHRVRVQQQAHALGRATRYHPADDAPVDVLAIDLPPVDVVDMRQELKAGNLTMFSRALSDALRQTLDRGEQAILFLNRRGSASYVFCRDCGTAALCPRCDTPLTYHANDDQLHCHLCDYRGQAPQTCPACGSKRIRHFGAGTQQVEAALRQHFPLARGLRWDADAAAASGGHDLILDRFSSGMADVLIGTQMIAKGLDLPRVTLVGVVSADTGLNLPDFRAVERTFQVLTQVAGRAGRGVLGGRVILQSYQPDHYAIQAAARHDTDGFYRREIAARRELGYPPFRRLLRVLLVDPVETRASEAAHAAAAWLQERITALNLHDTALIGPVPCFFSRINRQYRWQVLLRGPDPASALRDADLPRGWIVDPDPIDLL